MEKMIKIHLEKLPEGLYLATSDDIQGVVAQGRTISETLEIARDVAKKLIEEQGLPAVKLGAISDSFEYPLIVGT
jgi:predicted RNase H-like HicB family nuclease